ncbi:helix-turn-helix domain-containing protein [Enterococcus plantarum]|uniref:Rgg family transcriptional regulator n=1 Tax=Enterococcus plantarum TaxID=1077675 RepID=UPI001A8C1237|nr:helix-turn-helix domain-containing protein [Enterococcus plantarum]MBO0422731.1 hypothetical protein [Enterococcus plantarum]
MTINYNQALKQIRKAKKTKISEISIGKSRYSYSRIEKGDTKINLEDLTQILDNLEISFNEYLMFANYGDPLPEYRRLLNRCVSSPDNSFYKSELLAKYYIPKNIKQKNKLERLFLVGIVGNFSSRWEEVKPLTSDKIIYIFDKLINQSFYSEYDYLIAINLIPMLSIDMLDSLVNALYPIQYKEQRETDLIQKFYLMIMNIVSFAIYNLDYKKALYYINLIENDINVEENYYLKISILYHKNVVLRFLKKDTFYIEKARQVIKLVYDLGDNSLAQAYEKELNELIEDPSYYLNNFKYPTVAPRN